MAVEPAGHRAALIPNALNAKVGFGSWRFSGGSHQVGMFDEYIPDPPLRCPACGSALDGWQGKDGPNALMVWRQGFAGPIDQSIDDEDVKLRPEQLAKFRLPKQFTIYTFCCGRRFTGGRFFVEAECYASGETWSRTELVTAGTAKQGKNERRGDFKARVRWLSGKAT